MKVLLVTQYFYPEQFKSNDIAFELAKKGYDVDVLAGIPNYPEGQYYKGFGLFHKRNEVINGVHIYRVFQIPRGHGGWRLPLNYFSYVICACLWVLFFFAWKKYDRVICHAPSPIFQAYPTLLLKTLRKVPVYLWVLDIWPDAMRSGGGVKNERLISVVDKMVRHIYRHCDKILISSRRFKENIVWKGINEEKIAYFPNWCEDMMAMDKTYDIPSLPEGYKILMAGNLGKSQDLGAVGKLMVSLKDIIEIKWLFVGDGSKKEWLDIFIHNNHLEDVAYTYGKFPFEAMPAFYDRVDAMLLSLSAGFPHLGMVVPARLQSYMSAGKPVLAMIGEGGADIIREADCGIAVEASDADALAKVIREQVLVNSGSFAEKGMNGRKYYEDNYRMEDCIDHLCEILN